MGNTDGPETWTVKAWLRNNWRSAKTL